MAKLDGKAAIAAAVSVLNEMIEEFQQFEKNLCAQRSGITKRRDGFEYACESFIKIIEAKIKVLQSLPTTPIPPFRGGDYIRGELLSRSTTDQICKDYFHSAEQITQTFWGKVKAMNEELKPIAFQVLDKGRFSSAAIGKDIKVKDSIRYFIDFDVHVYESLY